MKIIKVEVFVVKIPPSKAADPTGKQFITNDYFVGNFRRSCVYSVNLETVLVKVTTDGGIVGWGEILAPTNPEVVATLLEVQLAPMVIGEDPLLNQTLWDRTLDTLRERGYTGGYLIDALTGLDIAYWDIKGKALNQPVYRLLGGKYRDKLQCYQSSVPGDTIEEKVKNVEEILEAGFNGVKIHTMNKGKSTDLEVIKKLRTRYSADELTIMYDAHGKLAHSEAYTIGRALSELDVLFFESPITFEDREGHRKLAEAVDIAIAVGEPLRTIYTFKDWITSGAVEIVQPDMGRNGITEMMRIATLAESHHIPFAPHLSVHHAIGHAATIHVSAATSNFLLYEYQPNALKASATYSEAAFSMENGQLSIPEEPGLGVEVNETLLRNVTTSYHVIN